MANPSSPPDANEHLGHDTGAGSDRSSPPPTPRWVLVFGIIALALGLLLVVMLLIGGDHGPGRHAQPGGDSGGTPSVALRARSGGPGDQTFSSGSAAGDAPTRHGEQRQ